MIHKPSWHRDRPALLPRPAAHRQGCPYRSSGGLLQRPDMAEVWLKTNRRALALGMTLPAILVVAALSGLIWAIVSGKHWAWQLPLLLLAVVPLWMIGELLYALWRPRIGYE